MIEPLAPALARIRALVLDPEGLVRVLASGRRRGQQLRWTRIEGRYVDLRAGRHLQITRYDQTQAHVANYPPDQAGPALDELLAEPFTNWHVETLAETVQLRVTKSGGAALGVTGPAAAPAERRHDREKPRMLPEDDPVLVGLGISDSQGRVKPSRRAKYHQVEEFVRELAATVDDALAAGRIAPSEQEPLRLVDLGCGNAYLTFAAHAWLVRVRGLPVRLVGVDVKEQSRQHNTDLASRLGVGEEVSFVRAGIADVVLEQRPDVVVALHACDTATDEALARGVEWGATVILAAPCCHHDVSRQLRAARTSSLLTRDGILRERFADTLTDALRAATLRAHGYRVEVVEFVESEHTPRNTLIRATATGAAAPGAAAEHDALAAAWNLRPRLAELLG